MHTRRHDSSSLEHLTLNRRAAEWGAYFVLLVGGVVLLGGVGMLGYGLSASFDANTTEDALKIATAAAVLALAPSIAILGASRLLLAVDDDDATTIARAAAPTPHT